MRLSTNNLLIQNRILKYFLPIESQKCLIAVRISNKKADIDFLTSAFSYPHLMVSLSIF